MSSIVRQLGVDSPHKLISSFHPSSSQGQLDFPKGSWKAGKLHLGSFPAPSDQLAFERQMAFSLFVVC